MATYYEILYVNDPPTFEISSYTILEKLVDDNGHALFELMQIIIVNSIDNRIFPCYQIMDNV